MKGSGYGEIPHVVHYLPGMTEKSDSNFRVSSFGNI